MAKTSGGESVEPQKLRIETSWPAGSRELDDLARVAKRISGNPQRRGEASAYLIRLWSEVLHGEISPATFWEMFGVTALPAAPSVAQQSALPPAPAREAYTPPPATQEVSQREERRANREKNRAAQADQWAN
ncbi:MAG TPA: hypothetical protein VKY19_14265 [Ktedonosporobacter sp.]|jgi:hypothetical protein|nr:hypothetical protein [Ktedonosporobacter sp.]